MFRSLLDNTIIATKALKDFGVSAHLAGKALDALGKRMDTRILSPSFVCGTINKESLTVYNYNIDELLNDKGCKKEKLF